MQNNIERQRYEKRTKFMFGLPGRDRPIFNGSVYPALSPGSARARQQVQESVLKGFVDMIQS